MGTTQQSFQPRSDAFPDMTGQAAYPTPNWIRRLSADSNGLTSTTKALFPAGTGTSLVTLRPTLSVTSSQSPATDANKKLCGWVMNPRGSLGFDSVATAKRFIPAGQWRFKCRLTATVTQPTTQTTVYIDAYKRHPDGTFTHLFNCSGLVAVSTTGSQIDLIAFPSQVTLEEDETLHFSVTIQAPTVAVTGQEITFQHNDDVVALGVLQSLWIFPAPGVRTLFPRSNAETAPASDALVSQASRNRALVDTALASETLTRALTASRAISDSSPAADILSRIARFPRVFTESAPASDVVTRQSIRPRALSDSALASDSLVRTLVLGRALADSAPATDLITRAVTAVRGISDMALATDVLNRFITVLRSTGDNAPAADSVERGTIQFRRITADTALASDVLGRQLNNVRYLQDNIGPDAIDLVNTPGPEIAGVVRNATGVPVEGAVVKLFRQSDDRAVRETVSAADGSYSFVRDVFDTESYYVVSYLEGVPQTQGISERGQVPA